MSIFSSAVSYLLILASVGNFFIQFVGNDSNPDFTFSFYGLGIAVIIGLLKNCLVELDGIRKSIVNQDKENVQ